MFTFINNRFFIVYSSSSFLLLLVALYLIPDGFNEFRNTDSLAPFWYFITSTAGIYGASAAIILLFVILMKNFRKRSGGLKGIMIFMTVVIFVQTLISASTLFIIKDAYHNPRPSQLYFIQKGILKNGGREFFALPPKEKSNYLREEVDINMQSFEDIYPPILSSWIYESGYSFPSGHAQTSFFLGTILAFVIYKSFPGKYYFVIPVIWAVLVALSRVLIGVHFPRDVIAGAFMSLVLALIIVSLRKFKIIFE